MYKLEGQASSLCSTAWKAAGQGVTCAGQVTPCLQRLEAPIEKGFQPVIHRACCAQTQLSEIPYSLAALSQVILRVTSAGTPAKFFAITSRECGQVESVCGKSEAHM